MTKTFSLKAAFRFIYAPLGDHGYNLSDTLATNRMKYGLG